MAEITAIRFHAYGPVDVLSADRIEAPTPAPGEVAIDMKAASVNPIDWKLRKGLLKDVFPARFPVAVGRDGSGVIADVGEGVDPGRIGQRVAFMVGHDRGTFAERITLRADLAVAILETLSFAEAAALPLAGLSAWSALAAAPPIEPGMRVLIHAGAGGIGTLAIQLACLRGASVAATCSARNADFVRNLGASEVIAHDEDRFEDRLTDLDLVFDTVGGEVHARSYGVLKKGGALVALNAAPFVEQSADYGVTLIRPTIAPDPAALTEILALAGCGKLKPIIDRIYPFAEFRVAQGQSETGPVRGKIVVEIGT
ncbi:NADP-dependent oxidoreductase [Amorphus sp. 3PC139-8]|uniref:NADP-dependent oxidoreductase n=1 Tax=Amorphus sp. 3PC139-8 TaxID=2735676 RepID=UPI00345CB573